MERADYHAVNDPERKRSKSSGSQSFLQLIIGGIMLGFGITYQDDCENGATEYLVTGGAIIIAANILPFITSIVIVFAISDDYISKSESFVIKTLLCIQGCLPLVSFGVTIWVKNGTRLKYFYGCVFLPNVKVTNGKSCFPAFWSY